jgi:hypothetical protein
MLTRVSTNSSSGENIPVSMFFANQSCKKVTPSWLNDFSYALR